MGNIKCKSRVNGNVIDILIRDVFYIKELKSNLISVSKIVQNNNRIIFMHKNCQIIKNDTDEILVVPHLENNLYKFNLYFDNAKIDSNETVLFTKSELIHKKLGHAGFDKIKQTANASALRGLDIHDVNENDFKNCETRIKSKNKKLPYKKFDNKYVNPLQIISSDVCYVSEDSFSDCNYFVTFVDHSTNYCTVYPIKSKTEVFSKFVEFKNYIEKQTNLKLKVLRSDNGLEYCNTNFNEYCKSEGIFHERIVSYNPASAGKAEGLNSILLNQVRSMLIESKLSFKFWAEAINTACYIRNRLVIKNQKKSPYEMLFKIKPSFRHFHIFGCFCYNNNDNILKSQKLHPRASLCIFLNYNNPISGYRLFELNTGKIINARNVIFLDDKNISNVNDENIKAKYLNNKFSLYLENERKSTNEFIPVTELKTDNEIKGHNIPAYPYFNYDDCTEETQGDQGRPVSPEPDLPIPREDNFRVSRYGRVIRPPVRYCPGDSCNHTTFLNKEVEEKLVDPAWRSSMEKEIQAMKDNEVWTLVPFPN